MHSDYSRIPYFLPSLLLPLLPILLCTNKTPQESQKGQKKELLSSPLLPSWSTTTTTKPKPRQQQQPCPPRLLFSSSPKLVRRFSHSRDLESGNWITLYSFSPSFATAAPCTGMEGEGAAKRRRRTTMTSSSIAICLVRCSSSLSRSLSLRSSSLVSLAEEAKSQHLSAKIITRSQESPFVRPPINAREKRPKFQRA